MINKAFSSGIKLSIRMFPCTAHIRGLASVLRRLIHTYVSLMRQRQRLLGWGVRLSLRGRESVSAFLNVKPLWLKKHTAFFFFFFYSACICGLRRDYYGCGDGLGGESTITDPGDTATIISPLIVDWSKRPWTGGFHKLFFPCRLNRTA